MTPEEKKERIDKLWAKLRASVRLQGFVLKTQKTMNRKFIENFAYQDDQNVEFQT